MNDEQTKTALITGANRGIGYAIAEGLLEEPIPLINFQGFSAV